MRLVRSLIGENRAAASAEMAMVAPMLIILMFGSMELGNFFLLEHAVTKQVRDGARYASRLTLHEDFSCPGQVFADGDANTKIINVTKVGAVEGGGSPRFPDAFWVNCTGSQAVAVEIRCVPKGSYAGIYSTLDGSIPVVSVKANVAYNSLFSSLGFNTTGYCMRAESEVPVAGL